MTVITQASGSNAVISFFEESSYGETPGTPALYQLAAAVSGVSLKATVEKLVSNAISSVRGVADARGGNITAGGEIPFELPITGFTRLLKHALGTSATFRHATLSTGLTGITVKYADNTCPTGAGTLTLSGSNLTWQANGDGSAGAAVDVSSAGSYTLQSGTASHALYIESAGSPTGTSATVTVSTTLKAHVLKRGALAGSLGFEIAYPDIGYYEVFNGGRINSVSFKVDSSGFVTGSLNVVCQKMTPGASALGTPTSYVHVPYVQHEAAVQEGGVAKVVGSMDFSLTNEVKGVNVAGSRYINEAIEGRGSFDGRISYLFGDGSAAAAVLNGTETSRRVTLSASTGESFDLFMPRTQLFGDAGAGIQTTDGLVVTAEMQAKVSSTYSSDVVITVVSTETSI